MPIPATDQNTKKRIAEQIASLRTLGVEPGGQPRSLNEIAAFIGAERSAPSHWMNLRSRPTRKAVAGLALFELSCGDQDKVRSFDRGVMMDAVAKWLTTAGYPAEDSGQVLDHFLEGELPNLEGAKPSLSRGSSSTEALLAKIKDYGAELRKLGDGYEQDDLRQLLCNRVTQEVAIGRFGHWLNKLALSSKIANAAVATKEKLGTTWEQGAWFLKDLVDSKHCHITTQFLIPTSRALDTGDVTDLVNQIRLWFKENGEKLGAETIAKMASKLKVYIAKNHYTELKPFSVWAFADNFLPARIGQILEPISADEHALERALFMLQERSFADISDESLWRYHSAPIQFELAVKCLEELGIHKNPCEPLFFVPADLSKWEIVWPHP